MDDVVIRAENISKRYRIGAYEKADTFTGQLKNMAMAPVRNFKKLRSLNTFSEKEDASVFWALRDINFEVRRGEVLGVIGHNGAGKSTLLKILSRITEPSSGQITIKGRVSSLLEVGTGFHDELTGRDNIYMNGTILGMTKKEIDAKLDEIVEFSGVVKHLDTPVKFYSSGMKVRLAFSVAAHLEPEILIIDEVLAVGDAEFQKKCLGKMESVAGEGRTVLFVSHDMGAINSLCNRLLVLNNGGVVYNGNVPDGIASYLNVYKKNTFKMVEGALGNGDYRITSLELSSEIKTKTSFLLGEPMMIRIKIENFNHEQVRKNLNLEIAIINQRGLIVSILSNIYGNPIFLKGEPGESIILEWFIDNNTLIPGDYTLTYWMYGSTKSDFIEGMHQCLSFDIADISLDDKYSHRVTQTIEKGIIFLDCRYETV